MRGQIGAAAVKQQGAPASAEGRNAVAVLQIKQPADASRCRGADGRVDVTKIVQSQEGAGVSSASGTPPGRSVHAHPPGAAFVYGCGERNCTSNQARSAGDPRNRVAPASH